CQPLDERSLGGDGRAQARRHLAQVDRPQELRQCLRGGGGIVRARLAGGRRPLGRLALGANLLPQLLRLRQCLLRGAQLRVREHRRPGPQLRLEPVAPIGSDRGELPGAGAEPEAVGGNGGERLAHAAYSAPGGPRVDPRRGTCERRPPLYSRPASGPLHDAIPRPGSRRRLLLCLPGVSRPAAAVQLARRAAQAGQTVLISTGDKDMAQLVDGSITLINTMNNTVLDRDAVKAKFDVYPEQIVDYLALVGDSSDNIPGIDKVGPKTGARLLQQYGGLDELIGHVAEVPGKVGENLRTGLTTLELSRRLATIRTDLTLPLSVEELAPGPPDGARLRALYTRYELRALLRQLEGGDAAAG